MGVWIEISIASAKIGSPSVTPLVGVWIEIFAFLVASSSASVTPLVGVWIEILILNRIRIEIFRHSPCGSVD